jgi:hypothetical protein
MRLGFSLLGSGLAKQFDSPEAGRAAIETGEDIVQTLRNEWHEKQAENFRAIHGKRFMDQMTQLQEDYNRKVEMHAIEDLNPVTGERVSVQGFVPVDAQGTPKLGEFIRADSPEAYMHLNKANEDFYKETGRLSMEFLDTAGQYVDNPIISKMAGGTLEFFQKQAGYAATGRRESREQLQFMNEQESNRMARTAAAERLEATLADVSAEAAVVRSQMATNPKLRKAIKQAGISTDPNKWSKRDTRVAHGVLTDLRAEEQRRAEMARTRRATEYFRPIIPPTTPLEGAADVLRDTPLYQTSEEQAAGDYMADLRTQVLRAPTKQLTEALKIAETPADRDDIINSYVEQLSNAPQHREQIRKIALLDVLKKAYRRDD